MALVASADCVMAEATAPSSSAVPATAAISSPSQRVRQLKAVIFKLCVYLSFGSRFEFDVVDRYGQRLASRRVGLWNWTSFRMSREIG